MKKNIMKVALVAAVAAMAGYGVYANQTKEMMSDVMLENVEALANNAEYPASPNPSSKCKGGPYMCYMGQGNVWGKN